LRFQLPQFIETEVKLIGPLTLKQFLWVASGSAVLYVLFAILPTGLFFAIALPIGGLFIALAFVKISDIPLVNYILFAITYTMNPKRYIYQKSMDTQQDMQEIIIKKDGE
jgi:hypothetical protein